MTAPQPLTMADPLWRPSTKAPRLWAITASLFWVPVIVAEIVCAVLIPGIPSWVVGTVFAVTVLFAATYILMVPAWRYRVHRWEISDTAVYTRTGWFTQERRIAPISRVQTVDTERGPIDRMLGLATVTVTTASSAGAVKISALDQEVADRHGGSTDGDRGYQRGRRDVNEKQLGDPTAIEIPAEAETAAAEAAEEEQPWLRLDRRMLLVHPVNEVVKLLPVLLVSVVLGSQSGNHWWGLGVVTLLVIFGLLRYFTTTYRIGPVHVQLRTGVFQKKLLSVPRSRIRSVDVEAGVMHRLLGLSIVRIGTGQRAGSGHDSNKFELNALSTALVPDLRAALLAGAQQARRLETPGTPVESITEPVDTEIGHWEPSWVRYAPFSFTGIAIIAAIIGISFPIRHRHCRREILGSERQLRLTREPRHRTDGRHRTRRAAGAVECTRLRPVPDRVRQHETHRQRPHPACQSRPVEDSANHTRPRPPPRHDAQGTAPSAIGPRRAARRHHDRGQRREEGIFATAPAGTAQGSRASDGHRDR